MFFKNRGLTVGDLTIILGICIFIGILWSTFLKNNDNEQSLNLINRIENELVSSKKI